MLEVRFYSFSKESNSTMHPATNAGASFSCILKSPTSVLNPTIELQLPMSAKPQQYNYARIEDFGRFYWIDNWIYDNRLWVASLRCDVLASYKAQIGAQELYVLRAESEYDLTIKDDLYPAKLDYDSYSSIELTPTIPPWWFIQDVLDSGCYVVSVVANTGMQYHAFAPDAFIRFCNRVFDPTLQYYVNGLSELDIGAALTRMIFKPAEYISSVHYLPIEMDALIDAGIASQPTPDVNIGFWAISIGSGAYRLNNVKPFVFTERFDIPQHPSASERGITFNEAPFTELYLVLPRLGEVPIDTSKTAACDTLRVRLEVDVATGEGVYKISAWDSNGDAFINLARYNAIIGVSIPVSNIETVTLAKSLETIGTTAAAIAAPSPITIAGAVSSAVSLFDPKITTYGNPQAFLGLVRDDGIPILRGIQRFAVDEDLRHMGRPLYKRVVISTLSGYLKCMDGAVAIEGAYKQELDEIRGFLEGGMYYE